MPNSREKLMRAVTRDPVYIEREGVGIIVSERLLKEEGLSHGFTTRRGGVSKPPFDSLNLGTSRPEPMENILENYKRLSHAYGLEYDELALVNHEHGDTILSITREDAGRGVSREKFGFCDGLVTDDPAVTLVTCHADCSAFFLYDRATRSIGLAHAGWKGMYKRIGQKLCKRMNAEFGAQPENMAAVIGPCICEKCFEVELELAKAFAEEFDCPDICTAGEDEKADKGYVSLQTAAVIQLLDAGIPIENISLMDHCTFEESDLFFSYRRDGKGTGSMAAFLRLE